VLIGSALSVAAAVGLALVERHARRRAERLAAALSETVLNAIDAMDAETGAHVRRVARYALLLARAARVSEADRRAIERVALFHDIGKVDEAVFDIIRENTSLTPDERQAVATHPDRGAAVLQPLADFYPELAGAVAAHHERWDGTGYPRGLRGSAIPFPARVVALADTFDAITHRRRYIQARGVAAAVDVIREGRGRQFDPSLVDLMLAPDTLERLVTAMRRAHSPRLRAVDRRGREPHTPGPDIRFRWGTRTPARSDGPM
jgi:putative two-component system response regulator